jgi:hypothetical protein
MWSRQVSTEEQAKKEVAAHRANGHRCTDPTWIHSPFKRGVTSSTVTILWTYSCDAGLVDPQPVSES